MRPGRLLSLVAAAVLLLIPWGAAASNDPLRQLQYALDRVEADTAWTLTQGAGVIIAVIDTGIDMQHEDLTGKIAAGRDFIDGDDHPQDENGHGTHVAGIAAAAAGNGRGIAGVAPAALIMPLRVLDGKGTGVESDVAEAIRYAFAQAQERNLRLVVNLSLTDLALMRAPVTSRLIDEAVREAWFAGAVVVAAAGNESLAENDYPAKGPNVLSVGATDTDDRRAGFSNRNPLVVAPGDKVVSTFWDPNTPDDHGVYASGSGTSMAAPHVSGLAALLLSRGMTNEQVVNRIVTTADDLGPPGADDEYGWGRVNAARALGLRSDQRGRSVSTELPLVAEGQFEKIPAAVDPPPIAAPEPMPSEPPARGVPLAAAAVLAVVAAGAAWRSGTGVPAWVLHGVGDRLRR